MTQRLADSAILPNGVRMPGLGLDALYMAEGGVVENAVCRALEAGYRITFTLTFNPTFAARAAHPGQP